MSRFQLVFPHDQSELNLSPMLDVVFIMLIFFVAVSTFVAIEAGRSIGLDVVPIAETRDSF